LRLRAQEAPSKLYWYDEQGNRFETTDNFQEIFAVQRSEPEAATPQRLVGVPIRYDLRKRGCRYYGLNDAESGSGRL